MTYHVHRPHGIMFHHFYDHAHPKGQGAISANDLEKIIRFLGPDRILTAKEWAQRSLARTLRPGNLCITFDDNLLCQYDVALPILRHFGITAFWFAPTAVLEGNLERLELYRFFRTTTFDTIDDFYSAFFRTIEHSAYAAIVEPAMMTFKADQYLKDFTFYTSNDRRFRFIRDHVLGPDKYNNIMDSMLDAADFDRRTTGRRLWMTEAMLRELASDGHIIGLHSHTHPTNLAALDRNDQLTEYQKSKARLTEIIGSEPITMSHPCNSYNRDTIDVLKELGVKIGFRANMAMTEVPSDFELPREDHANILKLVEPI